MFSGTGEYHGQHCKDGKQLQHCQGPLWVPNSSNIFYSQTWWVKVWISHLNPASAVLTFTSALNTTVRKGVVFLWMTLTFMEKLTPDVQCFHSLPLKVLPFILNCSLSWLKIKPRISWRKKKSPTNHVSRMTIPWNNCIL